MPTITYQGYTPKGHQKAVHNAIIKQKDKVVIVKSKRQCGKSYMAMNMLLYYGINFNSSSSMLISVTLAQSRKIFKELVNAIEKTGVIKKKNEQTLELELINKSIIYFKSSEQGTDSLRGYTIRNGILILDECSFLSEDILQAVLPFTNVYKAPILMLSTPKFKNCFFYRYFQMGLDKSQDKYISIDWNDYDTSEFLSDEQLNDYKKILPLNQFKTEFLGEFLDDEGVVFTNYKKCVKSPKNGKIGCFVGIDWGTGQGQDYTSISILNNSCEQVGYYSFNNLNTTQTIDRITEILKLVDVQLVLCESNSIGTPMTELLMAKNKHLNIKCATTTNQSKADMVSMLQVAFENETISILNELQQLNEIGSYECTFNPKTKNVTYNAPMGLHDDAVISLMLSLKAYNQGNKRGNYLIR